MRALGIDVGTKTLGLAVSDELEFTAQGLPTIRRTSLRADLEALQKVLTDYAITVLVLGLPLNMDGSEGARAEACRKLGAVLEENFKLPVVYQDERLTTVAAERVLLEGNVSRAKRKGVIDQVAASLILQGWLDARKQSAG